MPSEDRREKQAAAQSAVDILHEISTILNCHLDRRTLSVCVSMIENGVSPEALAVSFLPPPHSSPATYLSRLLTNNKNQAVVKELRKQGQEATAAQIAASAAARRK
ncbi:hypothetical protein RB598_009009 [Gaeumannomyces tritici]